MEFSRYMATEELFNNYVHKHRNDRDKLDAIKRIWWYSCPIVYPDWRKYNKLLIHARSLRHQKVKRTRQYLRDMINCYPDLFWCTFTFRDDVFETTSEKSRHQYVSRFLSDSCLDYYANIDWGDLNGREHYHALVALRSDLAPSVLKSWKYGFSKIKIFGSKKSDFYAVSNYLNALSLHANKITTGKSFHSRYHCQIDSDSFLVHL